MKAKVVPALLLIVAATSGCGRSSDDDDGLDANIANAFSNIAAAEAQNESDNQNAMQADMLGDDTPDNGVADLNQEMSDAANASVAIGAAQGLSGDDNPDPDGGSGGTFDAKK